ncbi:MAG: TauD/TfdA family dioxygenase, partial [Pseudomonadota bacterium]|nr:TauD/TfdA family dioxygenase [Pseudomonadota bacterium]
MSKDKSLVIKPLNNVGVEVSGLDINQPISNELKSQLHAIWLAHGIVVFRDQPDITPESLIEFSRIFGPLEMHPLKATTSAEYPELFVLENGGETDKFNTAYYDG